MAIKKNDNRKKEARAAARERGCSFCKSKTTPDWKQAEAMRPFLTIRSRIISRLYSGVCAKHQKILARQIKQARHLALLPFVSQG